MELTTSPLVTDLYQLNMMEAYLANGETRTGGLRVLLPPPARRNAASCVAAGLEQALDFLEDIALHRRRDRLACRHADASPPG